VQSVKPSYSCCGVVYRWCAAEEANRFKGSIFMVFEYMDHDLAGLADRGIRFSVPE